MTGGGCCCGVRDVRPGKGWLDKTGGAGVPGAKGLGTEEVAGPKGLRSVGPKGLGSEAVALVMTALRSGKGVTTVLELLA